MRRQRANEKEKGEVKENMKTKSEGEERNKEKMALRETAKEGNRRRGICESGEEEEERGKTERWRSKGRHTGGRRLDYMFILSGFTCRRS